MYKRVYNDNRRQAYFENALDCLYYGYGKSVWNYGDLNAKEQKEVWDKAHKVICES